MPADQSSHCHANAVKGGKISSMALALQREPTVYRSLLMVAGAVLTDSEPMLARLVRGCIALAFTACVLAVACSQHRLVDAVKGGELSSMALALQCEPTAYRSLLMVAGAVLANPEPMLARLGRGCIALAFTACVPTDQSSHWSALLTPSRAVSCSATWHWHCNASEPRTDRY